MVGIDNDEVKRFSSFDLLPYCRIELPFDGHGMSGGCFELGYDCEHRRTHCNSAKKSDLLTHCPTPMTIEADFRMMRG